MKLSLVVLTCLLNASFAQKVRYDNYSLYSVTPNTVDAINALRILENSPKKYNFWSSVVTVSVPVHIMVGPDQKKSFEEYLKTNNIDGRIIIDNVQDEIDREEIGLSKKDEFYFGWLAYHTLDEINDWLNGLAEKYPNIVTIISGGTTYEERSIVGVKISFNKSNENNSVFIDSNIHAREWITGAVNTYIINEILTSTDADFRSLVESFDWYIFPVINPDGFAYTHTNNRMWRKTRVPYGEDCIGADPNRNWGYQWNTGGSGSDPCSETYNGPEAFSEPCTKSLSEFITTIAKRLVVAISFHSYSQLLMVPYGYTYEKLDNYNETIQIGLDAAKALAKRYGTEYTVGNIAETIYVANGNSIDWIKGNFHTPYVYVYELRDTGTYAFLLPAEQILPTAQETLDSVIVILQAAKEKLKN